MRPRFPPPIRPYLMRSCLNSNGNRLASRTFYAPAVVSSTDGFK